MNMKNEIYRGVVRPATDAKAGDLRAVIVTEEVNGCALWYEVEEAGFDDLPMHVFWEFERDRNVAIERAVEKAARERLAIERRAEREAA